MRPTCKIWHPFDCNNKQTFHLHMQHISSASYLVFTERKLEGAWTGSYVHFWYWTQLDYCVQINFEKLKKEKDKDKEARKTEDIV